MLLNCEMQWGAAPAWWWDSPEVPCLPASAVPCSDPAAHEAGCHGQWDAHQRLCEPPAWGKAHFAPSRSSWGGGLEAAGLPYPHVPAVSFQDLSRDGERRLPAGAGDSAPGTPPRLVRVTARRTEAPASVCSLVLGSRSTLPQVSLRAPHAASHPASPAGGWH